MVPRDPDPRPRPATPTRDPDPRPRPATRDPRLATTLLHTGTRGFIDGIVLTYTKPSDDDDATAALFAASLLYLENLQKRNPHVSTELDHVHKKLIESQSG
jgi:hypothetical protein